MENRYLVTLQVEVGVDASSESDAQEVALGECDTIYGIETAQVIGVEEMEEDEST